MPFTRQLSEATAARTKFLAALAHELRNPLAPVKNSLELSRTWASPLHIAIGGRAPA
jgi:signal transduction histidine kinase